MISLIQTSYARREREARVVEGWEGGKKGLRHGMRRVELTESNQVRSDVRTVAADVVRSRGWW
jgi:hypothetical protein